MRCTCEGFDGSPGIGFVCLFLVSTLLRWTGAQLHTVRTEDDDDDDDDDTDHDFQTKLYTVIR